MKDGSCFSFTGDKYYMTITVLKTGKLKLDGKINKAFNCSLRLSMHSAMVTTETMLVQVSSQKSS